MNITNIDGTFYEIVEPKDATGLISNGKFIEGTFKLGSIFAEPFDCGLCEDKDWKALGAQPARPLVIPEGEYDLATEFTAEEWAKLVPGCNIEHRATRELVVKVWAMVYSEDGDLIVENRRGSRYDVTRHGHRPADNATAFIVGRRPKPVEPLVWEGDASEYAHAIMPIEFAGKRVRVEVVE